MTRGRRRSSPPLDWQSFVVAVMFSVPFTRSPVSNGGTSLCPSTTWRWARDRRTARQSHLPGECNHPTGSSRTTTDGLSVCRRPSLKFGRSAKKRVCASCPSPHSATTSTTRPSTSARSTRSRTSCSRPANEHVLPRPSLVTIE